ncbi:Ras-related small GTP-binding family protein [Zea mays]|jgi:hypothetical protein|nr:Ras-related small GTP-binding family protein [Zea mays]AQK65914.1 Ras-related small GTP-binding family protein [Zea mays]
MTSRSWWWRRWERTPRRFASRGGDPTSVLNRHLVPRLRRRRLLPPLARLRGPRWRQAPPSRRHLPLQHRPPRPRSAAPMSMMATRRTAPRAPPRSAAATPTQLLLVRSVCRLMSSWRHADLTATKRATHVLTDLAKNYKNRCSHCRGVHPIEF